MIGWILILLGIVAIYVVAKVVHFNHFKTKILLILAILLILFIVSTFASVLHNNTIDFKSPSGVLQAGKVYFMWLGQAFGNIKTLTANAVKMEWMPKNMSFSK
jgi:hypothetical protein